MLSKTTVNFKLKLFSNSVFLIFIPPVYRETTLYGRSTQLVPAYITAFKVRGSPALGDREQICFSTRIIKIMSSSRLSNNLFQRLVKKTSQHTNEQTKYWGVPKLQGFQLCSKPSMWASVHQSCSTSPLWGLGV